MSLKLANSFACGVFLAMCIISLVPASSSSWKKVLQPKHKDGDMNEMHESARSKLKDFPWSEFFTLVGFTMIFVIEVFRRSKNRKESVNSVKDNTNTGNIYKNQFFP